MQLFLLGGKAVSQENWARPQEALVVKNLPANAGHAREAGSIPRSGRSTGEGIALHYSILAWKIPWTEEPGPLQSMRSQRVGHDRATEHRTEPEEQSLGIWLPLRMHLFLHLQNDMQ